MKRSMFVVLFCAACVSGSAISVTSNVSGDAGCADDGVPEVWNHDVNWFGESAYVTPPVMLGRWEYLSKDRVLKIGEGQSSGANYEALKTLQLDSSDLITFMNKGVARMKLQDHPVGMLLHLSDVPNLWFGNTLGEPVYFHYQGATLGGGDVVGEPMSIKGQNVNGTSTATSVTGGDLLVTAGNASSAYPAPVDPGEIVLAGGKVGNTTRGNIALHDEPDSYQGMEGGVYIHNVATVPTTGTATGGFLYSSGGALYWVGSAGTVTQLAAP